jgi:PAS domain S-box-containing protein
MSEAEGASLEIAEGEEMVYQAATGMAAPFTGLRLKTAGSLSGLCMKSGVILRSDDTETDPRVDRAACRRIGARSMILLPLRYDEHTFGALKLMSARVGAFCNDTEKTLGLMGEFLSATISRKRAEASLRQSEANFRTMFETASIGLAQADPGTGRWFRVNRKLCEMLGYTVEELLARTIWDITYEPDRNTCRQLFQSLADGKCSSYHLEKRYVHKTGKLVWANVNVSILHDADGQLLRTVAAI